MIVKKGKNILSAISGYWAAKKLLSTAKNDIEGIIQAGRNQRAKAKTFNEIIQNNKTTEAQLRKNYQFYYISSWIYLLLFTLGFVLAFLTTHLESWLTLSVISLALYFTRQYFMCIIRNKQQLSYKDFIIASVRNADFFPKTLPKYWNLDNDNLA